MSCGYAAHAMYANYDDDDDDDDNDDADLNVCARIEVVYRYTTPLPKYMRDDRAEKNDDNDRRKEERTATTPLISFAPPHFSSHLPNRSYLHHVQ